MIMKLIGLLPASTIAAFIAEMLTKALANIKDKEKAAKISQAVSLCGKAVETTGKAVEDCQITEDEVNAVSADVQTAVIAIIDAAKK